MNTEMRRLMREAMSYEAVARKAKGAFETSGVAATIAGTIPLLGTPAGLAGLGSYLACRKAERKEASHKWYLLGTKMRETDLKRILNQD